jgi:glycosyltransferase involved in cell wall biosynthesis
VKISIITPNYNYEKYLPELLRSVALQDYLDIEHVIVDDGSTDNSVSVIQTFVRQYPNRFKLIQQANAGQSAALNTALKAVSGDLIVWINSDDYFTENIFKKIARFFSENPDVDIMYGDINFVDLESQFIFTHRNQSFWYSEAALLGFTMFLSSNAVVWRSNLVKNLMGFRADLKCNMDGEFYSRLFYKNTFSYQSLAIANFRKQPFSKAAENDSEWTSLMYREIEEELHANIVRIQMENWPKSSVTFLKYFIRIKRGAIRLISLRNWQKSQQSKLYQHKQRA